MANGNFRFQITDNEYYTSFTMTTSNSRINFYASNGGGYIAGVYGVT